MSIIRQAFGLPPRRSLEGNQYFYEEQWSSYGLGQHFEVEDDDSGERVNPRSAGAIPCVYSAASRISENLAACRLDLTQKSKDGTKKVVESDLAYTTTRKPNDEQGIMWTIDIMQYCVGIQGNAYAFLDWTTRGNLREWFFLHPRRVRPRRKNGQAVYEVSVGWNPETGATGGWREYPSKNIMHVRGTSSDGFMGLSPVSEFHALMGSMKAQRRFMNRLFKNSAVPRGIITTDPAANLTKEQVKEAKENWQNTQAGGINAGKTAFLPGGFKYNGITLSPADIQTIEHYNLDRADVAAIYKMSKHLLGDDEHSTMNNMEQKLREFATLCLRIWATRWEEYLNMYMLTDAQRRAGMYYRFDMDDLMRGDTLTMSQAITNYVRTGIMNINEGRDKIDLQPVKGGEINRMQMQMVDINANPAATGAPNPGDKPPKNDAPAPKNDQPDGQNSVKIALRAIICDATAKVLRKSRAVVVNQAQRHEQMKAFESGCERQINELENFACDKLVEPAVRVCQALNGVDDETDRRARFIARRAALRLMSYVRTALSISAVDAQNTAEIAQRFADANLEESASTVAEHIFSELELLGGSGNAAA
jgi:HK97 family phage portal protein